MRSCWKRLLSYRLDYSTTSLRNKPLKAIFLSQHRLRIVAEHLLLLEERRMLCWYRLERRQILGVCQIQIAGWRACTPCGHLLLFFDNHTLLLMEYAIFRCRHGVWRRHQHVPNKPKSDSFGISIELCRRM